MRTPSLLRPSVIVLAAAALVSGCAVGPAYQRPSAPEPAAYKELQGWVPAAPADALDRGPWWTLFNDPQLNELAASVEVSNQNVAAAVAAYAQARALVTEQRASLFPSLSLTGSGTRSGTRSERGNATVDPNGNIVGSTGSSANNAYRLSLGTSWEPDVWGRLRAGVTAASANAQASAADLASARLSAQGELASDYLQLRAIDIARGILATTIAGYQRVLTITTNRFNVGIVPHSDVFQAQTQLSSAQSDDLGLIRQRAQLEHAIAVLVGKSPAELAIAPLPQWQVTVPDVPVGVPSTLLQRRPDIAGAERRVAAANEQIGIARSAYFPNIGLNASLGTSSSKVGDLFNVSNAAWSFGLSAAQTLFDAGATRARVEGARAAHEEAVARYRQTVLDAFAGIEDQLAATRILAQQQELQRQASETADKVEQQVLNRYNAGQVSYSEVVQAQVTALNARRTLVQTQSDRQTTAVALIQALGGGWHAD
jgi:NodT family efflux transporter outer membrane factor (OMF) lipoprotein